MSSNNITPTDASFYEIMETSILQEIFLAALSKQNVKGLDVICSTKSKQENTVA